MYTLHASPTTGIPLLGMIHSCSSISWPKIQGQLNGRVILSAINYEGEMQPIMRLDTVLVIIVTPTDYEAEPKLIIEQDAVLVIIV